MTFLTLLFLYLGQTFGGEQGMIWAFVFALGMNFFSYWFSDKIVLKMYRAKEITEQSAPNLYAIVRRLAHKADLPMPKVYIIENSAPNAFATGRNPKHAAVAVTTGIVNMLSQDELSGVIAHELSHVRHRDILIGSIVATFAGAITLLMNMARWTLWFGGSSDDDGPHPAVLILMTILAPLAALLVQMAVSRSREFLADEGGAKLSGNPRFLASALLKLEQSSNQASMDAQPATAHMFIVNPLRGTKGLMSLFRTHPSTEERIKRLEAMRL